MNNEHKKIILGISGGVDSAVAALILKNQGHEVEAVFMHNWDTDQNDPYCSADVDLKDARAVCDKLNIPLHTVNFSQEYWHKVFQYLLDEYSSGRTPNPDIMCNKEIKFKAFLDYAKSLGADYIATGHYARIDKKENKSRLLKGIDNNKDQSYFLYMLTEGQLESSIFPIGHLKKTEVRGIAKKEGLLNFNKKDSTGICFIGERKFKEFLNEYLLAKPGDIITEDGTYIGKHDGIMFYTLGQRKGLKIGGQKNAKEAPWYVINKDIQNNKIIVSQNHDHPMLLNTDLQCDQIHWISSIEPKLPLKCKAKIRYRQPEEDCLVFQENEKTYKVKFSKPQWAITPGQSVVFYDEDVCLGGGIIAGTPKEYL